MLTFFYQFIFPGFLAVGIISFFWPRGGVGLDLDLQVLVGAASAVVVAYELWATWPIKRVLLDEAGGRLYVSNFRREIVIRCQRSRIFRSLSGTTRRITLHLRTSSEFGETIVFLATYRFGGWMAGKHPIVKELHELI